MARRKSRLSFAILVLALMVFANALQAISRELFRPSDRTGPDAATVAPQPFELTVLNGFEPVQQFAAWGLRGETSGEARAVARADLLADNYMLVFDGSASMTSRTCAALGRDRMETARAAVRTWLQTVPADANVGLFAFDEAGPSLRVPLSRDNGADLLAAVEAVRPGGHTPLGRSLTEAAHALVRQARRQVGYGTYNLVVITDGTATDGNLINQAMGRILQTPIVVHTIGFCIGSRHVLNIPEHTRYISAMDDSALQRGLELVLAVPEAVDVAEFGLAEADPPPTEDPPADEAQ